MTATTPLLERSAGPLARVAVVVAIHLLAVGHDAPGGGFVGGLVLGAGLALHQLAARRLPRRAFLHDPMRPLALGVLVVGAVLLAPVALGSPMADMGIQPIDLGALGSFKLTSALVFDIGVVLIVVGLVLTVLELVDDGGRA